MKFKEYIQSEINQKEVEPSHDAWDRIQARMQNQPEVVEETSTKKWWAIVAAIIGLAVCTTVFFTNQKTTEVQDITHQNTGKPNENPSTQNSTIEIEEGAIEVTEDVKYVDAKSSISNEKNPVKSSTQMANLSNQTFTEVEKLEVPKVTVDKIETPSLANGLKQTQLVSNLDTVKVNPKKKGNYVDPNMLLYSIENKESLKESNNQKSRVAVIDLNK